jgi:hypothetical protein
MSNVKNEEVLKSFIDKLREAYVSSRIACNYNDSIIERGRNRSVSGIAEDYFGCMLYEILNDKSITIFVDQAISFKKDEKTKTIYPDILICKKTDDYEFERHYHGKLKKEKRNCYNCYYMCDIKMDIGWIRKSLNEICSNHNADLVDSLNSKICKAKNGEDKKDFYIRIDADAKYDVIVLMCKNGLRNYGDFCENKNLNKDYRDTEKSTNCFLLTEGNHVNEYKSMEELTINPTKDFNMLVNRITKTVKRK